MKINGQAVGLWPGIWSEGLIKLSTAGDWWKAKHLLCLFSLLTPSPPLAVCIQLSLPHSPPLSATVEDSFNAPDNLCGRLRTMEIK